MKAVEKESGLESNPLTLSWLSGKPNITTVEGTNLTATEATDNRTANFIGDISSMPTTMPSFGFDSSKVKKMIYVRFPFLYNFCMIL